MEVERSQAPDHSSPAGSYLSIVLFFAAAARLNSVPGRGRRLVKTVSRELCHVVSFFFSHPRSLSLPCEVRPRSKTWKPELFSFLDCGATLDLSECCK